MQHNPLIRQYGSREIPVSDCSRPFAQGMFDSGMDPVIVPHRRLHICFAFILYLSNFTVCVWLVLKLKRLSTNYGFSNGLNVSVCSLMLCSYTICICCNSCCAIALAFNEICSITCDINTPYICGEDWTTGSFIKETCILTCESWSCSGNACNNSPINALAFSIAGSNG